MHGWVMTVSNLGCMLFVEILMWCMYLLRNVSIETFIISFEATQNKQQYGTKITCTELGKKLWQIRNVIFYKFFFLFLFGL